MRKLLSAFIILPLFVSTPSGVTADEKADIDKEYEVCSSGTNRQRIDACSRVIEQAVKDNDLLSSAHFYRAEAFSREKEQEKAIADFSRSNEYFAHPTNNYKRGNEYLSLKKYDEAIADYTYVIEKLPSHFGAYNNRGLAYWRTNQLELAIKDFDTGIEKDPVQAMGYYNRARVYLAYGKPESGLPDIEKLLEQQPDNPNLLETYGQLLEALDRNREAITAFKRALKLDADNTVVRDSLKRLEGEQ